MQLGDAYYQKGMFDEAFQEYVKGLSGAGYEAAKIEDLKKAFAKSGIKGFYQAALEQEKAVPQEQQNRPEIAELYARVGEKDAAFEWLEKGYAAHDDEMVRLREQIGSVSYTHL